MKENELEIDVKAYLRRSERKSTTESFLNRFFDSDLASLKWMVNESNKELLPGKSVDFNPAQFRRVIYFILTPNVFNSLHLTRLSKIYIKGILISKVGVTQNRRTLLCACVFPYIKGGAILFVYQRTISFYSFLDHFLTMAYHSMWIACKNNVTMSDMVKNTSIKC